MKFNNINESSFLVTLRSRVDGYFNENNVSKYANTAMWIKMFFFLSCFLTFYLLILSNRFNVYTTSVFTACLGGFGAFIGFNVCHDAIHGALSAHKRINRVFSLVFNVIGANAYVWSITHNMVHHSFTNIAGYDEDIDVAPGLIRISEKEKVNKIQRYQHFYAFALYGLASLSWVLRKDYLKFFKKKIGQRANINHPAVEYFNLFFYKLVYYFLFIVLPFLILPIKWWQLVIGFLIMHVIQGLVLGLVFQLAHVVEGTDFPLPNKEGNIENEWAAHQMGTTANFAPGSFIVTFLCGGLNFQIEHHLFPKVCHIHYPAIAHIVKQTAQEFNLPYIEYPSFASALKSHYRMLQKLGKEAYINQKVLAH